MEKKMTTIINSNNEKYEVEVILYFEVPEYNKKYVVFSYPNEKKNNNTVINIGELKENNILTNIESEKEWNFVKSVMSKIVNSKED